MDRLDPFEINFMFNIQRFLPGEGYHAFHCERASWDTRDRVGVWMIYLNDVHDRGWTEFIYQQHFEEAKVGKIVCWPSDWTHTHRGIISPTETKYILTGWFTFVNPKNIEKKMIKADLIQQEIRPCNFNDFYYYPKYFNDEKIEAIHEMVRRGGYKFEKGGTGKKKNK